MPAASILAKKQPSGVLQILLKVLCGGGGGGLAALLAQCVMRIWAKKQRTSNLLPAIGEARRQIEPAEVGALKRNGNTSTTDVSDKVELSEASIATGDSCDVTFAEQPEQLQLKVGTEEAEVTVADQLPQPHADSLILGDFAEQLIRKVPSTGSLVTEEDSVVGRSLELIVEVIVEVMDKEALQDADGMSAAFAAALEAKGISEEQQPTKKDMVLANGDIIDKPQMRSRYPNGPADIPDDAFPLKFVMHFSPKGPDTDELLLDARLQLTTETDSVESLPLSSSLQDGCDATAGDHILVKSPSATSVGCHSSDSLHTRDGGGAVVAEQMLRKTPSTDSLFTGDGHGENTAATQAPQSQTESVKDAERIVSEADKVPLSFTGVNGKVPSSFHSLASNLSRWSLRSWLHKIPGISQPSDGGA